MYVKIFQQIMDSSLAQDCRVRHVFMDLLVLANRYGEVDMTREAIARRTNCPLEMVEAAINDLEKPDPSSRSSVEDGRRIVRLDDHRDWGWQIVNYDEYRKMVDAESIRTYEREKKRRQRAKSTDELSPDVPRVHGRSLICPPQAEAEGEEEAKANKKNKQKPSRKLAGSVESVSLPESLDTEEFRAALQHWSDHKKIKRDTMTQHAIDLLVKKCEGWGPKKSISAINLSIERGWRGVFPEDQPQTVNGNHKPELKHFVTYDMVARWCSRKGWTKLTDIAWGKLMGGTYYGRAITNETDFNAAMSAIYEETDP